MSRLKGFWVPGATFALAVLLSALQHPGDLRARAAQAATGGCHIFRKLPGEQLCQSAESGTAEATPNCDKHVPDDAPGERAETRFTLKKNPNGSVQASQGARDLGEGILFPRGTPLMTPRENQITKILEIGPQCPSPPPCHNADIFLRAVLEVRLTLSAPTEPRDFAEAVGSSDAFLSLSTTICELALDFRSGSLEVSHYLRRSPTGRLESRTRGRKVEGGRPGKPLIVVEGGVAAASLELQFPLQPRRFDYSAVSGGIAHADPSYVQAAEGADKTASAVASVTFTNHDHYDVPEAIGEKASP
jgi:hypothetical protein